MDTYQRKLVESLRELDSVQQDAWKVVIRATNDLVSAIRSEEEHVNPDLTRDLEGLVDAPALRTAWIYSRLEDAIGSRRDTSSRIHTALGYGKSHR